MSGPSIIAAGLPALNAFAGWRRPVHCRLVADVGATGAVVARAAKTTVGVSIVRDTTGQYTVSFPACIDLASINVQIYSVAPETADGAGYATVDANDAETGGTIGQFKFHTRRSNDGNNEDPVDGDVIDATFMLDFG